VRRAKVLVTNIAISKMHVADYGHLAIALIVDVLIPFDLRCDGRRRKEVQHVIDTREHPRAMEPLVQRLHARLHLGAEII
jgi:hypothetical protein